MQFRGKRPAVTPLDGPCACLGRFWAMLLVQESGGVGGNCSPSRDASSRHQSREGNASTEGASVRVPFSFSSREVQRTAWSCKANPFDSCASWRGETELRVPSPRQVREPLAPATSTLAVQARGVVPPGSALHPLRYVLLSKDGDRRVRADEAP